MDFKKIPFLVKGSIIGYIITFLILFILFLLAIILDSKSFILDSNNLAILFLISIFALVGIIFGLISTIIFELIKSKKKSFFFTISISVGFMILFIFILAYFVYFFTPSNKVKITNTIILEEDFSNYYFFSSHKDFKGRTNFNFIGGYSNLSLKVNPKNIPPSTFGLMFSKDSCIDIFIIPKVDYNSFLDLANSSSQKVISHLCYRTIESPYKNIAKIEHIYKINTNSINEKPQEIKIKKTPFFSVLAILCIVIFYINIHLIRKMYNN
ncbi:MAG: hypothetical protein ACLFPJ_00775 [Candidatus Woesearchaeota archaeon]